MRTIFTIFVWATAISLFAQSEKPANVYPSNLEENMYYEKYDAATATIKGIYFLVLSDGDNSQDYTPAFTVTLYLIPEGKSSASDAIRVKNLPLKGIYHMGSHEFKNINLSLKNVEGLYAGTYRLGIWVNSDEDFTEDSSDNAILFKGVISYDPDAAHAPGTPAPAPATDENNDTQEEGADDSDSWEGW